MPYGILKVDTITFTAGGVDTSVSISGLVQNPTFTGNITSTGTISGNIIQGGTTVSGATVTGTTANFVSGVFTTQISGTTIRTTTGVFASGTAAAPSITFNSDLDTGLFTGAANTVGISANGSAVLTVSGTSVGIGTNSPNAVLDLTATAGAGGQTSVIRFGLGTTAESWIGVANGTGNIIANSAQGDTVIRNDGGKILLSTDSGTTAHAVIDSSGRLGIGATPDSKLHVVDAIGNAIRIGFDSGVTNKNIYDAGQHIFRDTSGNNSLVIDSSKRLLVGTISGRSFANFGGTTQLCVEGTSFSTGSLSLTNNQVAVDGSYLIFAKSRGTAAGSVTTVSNDDLLGALWFQGADGTNLVNGAWIRAEVDGAPGTGSMPGRLTFSTSASGSGTPTERMRISSTGILTASSASATNGSTIIQGYYSAPNHLNVIGSQFSSAATAVCYAVRPKSGAAGYVSAAGNSNFAKGVIELDGNCAFKFASAATVAVGTDVSMTEVARFTTIGLTFNGDTAAANALDDYEEGTWTPAVGGTATYYVQEGRYTKIGRVVHASFYMTIVSVGTGSTNSITGLPFNAGNDTGGSSVSYYTGLSTSVVQLFGYIYSSNIIYLYSATGASTTVTLNSVLGNNSTVQGHLCYFV